MVLLTLLGAGAMVCHHFFCTYFNGKQVISDMFFDWRIPVSRQVLIGAAGNTIAAAGSFSLSAAIGIAAVQVLWSSLGQRSHSIRQIRAILECRTQPFTPISWPAWSTSRSLTLLAIFSSSMTLITIIAPSSLRTAPSLSSPVPCTIKRVDLSGEGYDRLYDTGGDPNAISHMTSQPLQKLVARNIIDGSYITPANPCNQSCSYILEFNAPATNCSVTTLKYDFGNMSGSSNLQNLVIWNSTHDIHEHGSTIQVATMGGLNPSDREAFTCEVFNATYSVDVFHNGTATTINISNIDLQQNVTNANASAPEYNAFYYTALALGQMFFGIVEIDVNAMAQEIPSNLGYDNHIILYSALGKPNPSSNPEPWLWDPNTPGAVSELATNISISLLSNPLGISMIDVQTTCQYLGFQYVYNPFHLFLTYGVGLVTAIFCLLMGFISIYINKREETLHFSRLLVAILDPKLSEEVLTDETRLIAGNRASGNSATYSQFKKVY